MLCLEIGCWWVVLARVCVVWERATSCIYLHTLTLKAYHIIQIHLKMSDTLIICLVVD